MFPSTRVLVAGAIVAAVLGVGWVLSNHLADDPAIPPTGGVITATKNEIEPTPAPEELAREPIEQGPIVTSPTSSGPAASARRTVDDVLPDIGQDDMNRITDARMQATTREEWATLGIDLMFAVVFDRLRKGGALERAPDFMSPTVNPRGITLDAAEEEQLRAVLAPLDEEIDLASAFHQVETYFAYREVAANTPPVLMPDSTPIAASARATGAVGHAREEALESTNKMLKRLAAEAGGRGNFKHAVSTDFPTADEWATFKATGALSRTRNRVFVLTRAEHPSVFAAQDRLQELINRRLELTKSFFASIQR